jgi:uncharacterized protein YndB with AHSA1/START domain
MRVLRLGFQVAVPLRLAPCVVPTIANKFLKETMPKEVFLKREYLQSSGKEIDWCVCRIVNWDSSEEDMSMRRRSFLPIAVLVAFACTFLFSPNSLAKNTNYVTEKIEINAPPEYVFQAIRKQRDDASRGRSTISFDGKVARIDDRMENVAIYGKVHSVWEETELPNYEGMDYKMISSDHFKSADGKWILTPSADKKTTTLELRTLMDSGLRIPFADNITRMNLSKDSKERLERLKKWAEADYKDGVKPVTPPIVKG